MALKIQKVKVKSNQSELRVLAVMSQHTHCESFTSFESNCKESFNKFKKINIGRVDSYIKFENQGDYMELWHLNMKFEKDRLMAIITKS